MIYWGSKNKGITRRVYDLCASKSLELIEALISSSAFKTFVMAICSAFHFLEGGEPPLLLLSLFHKLPAKILNIQTQNATEP